MRPPRVAVTLRHNALWLAQLVDPKGVFRLRENVVAKPGNRSSSE